MRPCIFLGHKATVSVSDPFPVFVPALTLLLPLAYTPVNALVPSSALEGAVQLPVQSPPWSKSYTPICHCLHIQHSQQGLCYKTFLGGLFSSTPAPCLQVLLHVLHSLFASMCLAVFIPVKHLSFVLAKSHIVIWWQQHQKREGESLIQSVQKQIHHHW